MRATKICLYIMDITHTYTERKRKKSVIGDDNEIRSKSNSQNNNNNNGYNSIKQIDKHAPRRNIHMNERKKKAHFDGRHTKSVQIKLRLLQSITIMTMPWWFADSHCDLKSLWKHHCRRVCRFIDILKNDIVFSLLFFCFAVNTPKIAHNTNIFVSLSTHYFAFIVLFASCVSCC